MADNLTNYKDVPDCTPSAIAQLISLFHSFLGGRSPNNTTLVINTHARIYGVRNGVLEKIIQVTGRGRGN